LDRQFKEMTDKEIQNRKTIDDLKKIPYILQKSSEQGKDKKGHKKNQPDWFQRTEFIFRP